MKIGDKFKLTEDAIDNYGEEYRDIKYQVNHVAKSVHEHPGYDPASGCNLYDADNLTFSLYEWEVYQVW